MSAPIVRVMAIGADDFLRRLARLPGAHEVSSQAGRGWATFPAAGVMLFWHVLQPSQAGSLWLPQLEITLQFEDMHAPESALFMRKFDLVFQRGGG
jgi:hypothetical protein